MAHDSYEKLYKSEGTIDIEEVLSHVPRKVIGDMNTSQNACILMNKLKPHSFRHIYSRNIGIYVVIRSRRLPFAF
jgi:5'(3')-deoxyribonucleotidase